MFWRLHLWITGHSLMHTAFICCCKLLIWCRLCRCLIQDYSSCRMNVYSKINCCVCRWCWQTSMKPSLQPVFGINQTGAVFPRTSNPQPVQPNLTLRAATPGYKVLCDTNHRTNRHILNNAYWLYTDYCAHDL